MDKKSLTETDIRTKYITPAIVGVGGPKWNVMTQVREESYFTKGRVIVRGKTVNRGEAKKADYILFYKPNLPIAVVEAKDNNHSVGDGMQQALDYAQILDVPFAYSSNGDAFLEHDRTVTAGTVTREIPLDEFPSPAELWSRYCKAKGYTADQEAVATQDYYDDGSGKSPRYYQLVAINRTVDAIARGENRILLVMATGTGKTYTAFQIIWRLWKAGIKKRILFLVDRNILANQTMIGDFKPFKSAMAKLSARNNSIETKDGSTIILPSGITQDRKVDKSYEIYLSLYQAVTGVEEEAHLFKQFSPDFFDLIVVDECHRGSAAEDSNWRQILEYFSSATQIGMTATPKETKTVSNIEYFGDPLYTYSLKQGIADGFLAPYKVVRIGIDKDLDGWRPESGQTDKHGQVIEDREYNDADFDRNLILEKRTELVAAKVTQFLRATDRFAKTIIFCVDQDHADEMRRALANCNADLVKDHPDYVCRVTADEGDIGRGHLEKFQDVDTRTPTILTTSQLLTTGVDAPTCKNVVLARVVGSMSEFKQIIGRGTRVRDDYGKLWFSILDYTGSATQKFADKDFDGDPVLATVQELSEAWEENPIAGPDGTDNYGEIPAEGEATVDEPPGETSGVGGILGDPPGGGRKYFFDGGQVTIAAHLVYELDPDGKQLRVVRYTEYAGEKIRTLFPDVKALRHRWADPASRAGIITTLAERGIDFDALAESSGQPDADPFDLICHLAHNAPLRTRRERAQAMRSDKKSFFDQYQPEARVILEELLEKYAEHGTAQFVLPDVIQVPPLSDHGQPGEIVKLFGGVEQLRCAVTQLQTLLYSA